MPNQVTLTVAQVLPPERGKKRGKVIDTLNIAYQVSPDLLYKFQPGATYTVSYKDDRYNGYEFKVIEGVVGAATSSTGANQPFSSQQNSVGIPTNETVQAPAQTIPSKQYGRQLDPGMAERIFVCGALNAALSNQNITPTMITEDQLTAMVNVYRKVFRRTFGGQPSTGDAMNDEIPF